MPRAARPLFAALLLGLAALPAQAVEPSITVRRLQIDISVRPDGTASIIEHREQSPATSAVASRIGEFAIGFNPSSERLQILEAYTRKPGGGRHPVDLGQIQTQLAPGVPDVPIFQDLQQKVAVFPDLGAGDTEVITYREDTIHPLFPGQFFWSMDFARTIAWDDVAITVTAPADYPLRTESDGVEFARTEQDGGVRYTWRYRKPDVVAEDLAAVSPWDRLPRLYVSSFPDYTALAAAYGRLAEPKAVVTRAIQRRADAITTGITDRRAQAEAIYDWVSRHIRYVALYLGTGGVEPHAAAEVLDDGYGDCKDHSVLFEALLKAKGIESHPVLINLDTAYTLSGPPTLAQLDHVITWLPEFGIYADTTIGVAPFGTLPFQEYGKPAVLVGGPGSDNGPALREMPLLAPGVASIGVTTTAHMDLDGAILGTSRITATGPAAVALRLAARAVETAGHERAARRMLDREDEEGTGVFQFAPPDELGPSFIVDGQFRLDPQPEILEGDSFAPPLGLQLLVRPGDYFLGPLHRPTLAASEPTPCFPGRQVEDLSLQLPEGRAPERLPQDISITNAAFSYSSHWTMQGQTIAVHREMISRIAAPLCSGTLRQDAVAAQAAIRRDERAKVELAMP